MKDFLQNESHLAMTIDSFDVYHEICGIHDRFIPLYENEFQVQIIPRGNTLIFRGLKDRIDFGHRFFTLLEEYLTRIEQDYKKDKANKRNNGSGFHDFKGTNAILGSKSNEIKGRIREFQKIIANLLSLEEFETDKSIGKFLSYLKDLSRLNNNQEQYLNKEIQTGINTDTLIKPVLSGSSEEEIEQRKAFGRIEILNGAGLKVVEPKSLNQDHYIRSLSGNTITFAIGPAGTGKTFLAVACALFYLFNSKVKRIILTRPAVEAGESLGFLPGDLQQKVNPYLRPLYDSLFELAGPEKVKRLIEEGTIEIAPLAFMRGRTLSNSFIILDEAQNTTGNQLKMFLTRLGHNTKMAISGDITQIDLEGRYTSGLLHALQMFSKIEGIGVIKMTRKDITRHPLVEKIIQAYEQDEKKTKSE